MLFEGKSRIIEENLGGDLLNYCIKTDEYELMLLKEKCLGIWNDETDPIHDLTYERVASWMSYMPVDAFEIEYFEDDCEICPPRARGKKKLVPYLEGHFYVFTKEGESVTLSVHPDYISGSFESLLLQGIVDQSYILSVIICPTCGHYQFSLEQVDM